MKFNINPNIYGQDAPMYKNTELELNPGVTCLIGRNGSGKSTLIWQLKMRCEEANIPYIRVDNYRDGGHNYVDLNYNPDISIERLGVAMQSSEGQRIIIFLGDMAQKLGQFTKEHNQEDNIIAIDAIDSGLDLHNIEEVRGLLKLIASDSPKSHIVVAGNTFDITEGFRCIDVKTFKEIDVSTYDKFKAFICGNVTKRKNRKQEP